MKPSPFRYERAEDVEHALALLAENGDDAKIIAGGQSLAAVMNLRLSRPEMLIDIDRLHGLSHVVCGDGGLRVGALVRHRQIERYPATLEGWELLPRAARFIGHYPIRVRGTFGGSIAHADPAAEWVVLATMLDADIRLTSATATRTVGASDFFQGFFTTAAAPDELLTEVCFPVGVGCAAITEFARRHGDFAVVAAAVGFDLDGDGRIRSPRLALGGVGSTPRRLTEAAQALEGVQPGPAAFEDAARSAAAEIDDPPTDSHGDAGYRRHLVRTLVRRALEEALHDAG